MWPLQSLIVHNFYLGSGLDYTGVPTKMVTTNCSLKISVYNPATLFGIHVSSTSINLIYSKIPIATGQVNFHLLVLPYRKGNFIGPGTNSIFPKCGVRTFWTQTVHPHEFWNNLLGFGHMFLQRCWIRLVEMWSWCIRSNIDMLVFCLATSGWI